MAKGIIKQDIRQPAAVLLESFFQRFKGRGEAARRARIGQSRLESIEPPTRGYSWRLSIVRQRHAAIVLALRLPGWPIRLFDPNRLVYLEIDAVAVAVGVRQLRLARFGAHCRYVNS